MGVADPHRQRRHHGLLAVVVVLLLAACGGDDDGGDAGAPTDTTAPDTTAPETTMADDEPAEPVGDPGTAAVEAGGFPDARGETALLVDVRIGDHDGFDRVVFEFEGEAAPSYRVAYLDPPVREDFSGHEVELDGDAFLEIRTAPAAGFDPTSDDFQETYTGPDRLEPDTTDVVEEATRLGDFEGQLAWAVGLAERVPFGVTVLEDPLRLVVDVLDETEPSDDSAVPPLTNQCTFTEAGWEVTVPYPADWVANDETATDTGTVPACRIFDATDATPPRANELNAFGFLLHVDPVQFDDIDGPSPDAELLSEEELTVDDRRARRVEDRLTESGLRGPEGARVTTFTVDLDGAILVARTHEVADLDYERNRAVLDAVMGELSLRGI